MKLLGIVPAILFTLVVAACGANSGQSINVTAGSSTEKADDESGPRARESRQFKDKRTDPPDPNARPRVTAEQALATCRTHGITACPSEQEGGYQELAEFSDDVYGPTDERQPRTFQRRLAWVFVDLDAKCFPALGPPGRTPPPEEANARCVHVVVIDAGTGEFLTQFWE
jgi:hypothetical protein